MVSKSRTRIYRFHRNPKGVSILFLCVLIGTIVLPMMAIFTYEVVRAVSIHEQLQTSCEAAALSGAAVLAGSDNSDVMTTHADLTSAALSVFRANAVYETSLSSAAQVQHAHDNPAANAAAFTDGWFRTGDEGYLDTDGYVFITSRIKELINRGGEKVAPPEVEDVLLTHPAVAQAVVFPLPHPTLGEAVAAAVVVRPGATTSLVCSLPSGRRPR